MGNRYLLFDSSCSVCTDLAKSIEEVSEGWLSIKSLHNHEVQNILDESKPNWEWEPTIIEINNENQENQAKVYTGVKMQSHILKGLGIRKSLQISKIIREANLSKMKYSNTKGRRTFLKKGSFVLGGILVAPMLTTLLPNKITNKVFAESTGMDPEDTSGDWRSKIKIKDSKELTKSEIQRFMTADAKNALNYNKLNVDVNSEFLNSENVQGVHHKLQDNNTLLAISVQKEDYVAVYYSLGKPINHFKSGSYLYYGDNENQKVIEEDRFINGKPVTESTLQTECGNCTIENFTFNSKGSSCAEYDWSCMVHCCGPCSLVCKTIAGCLPCVVLWCPICAAATCCERFSSYCYSCA